MNAKSILLVEDNPDDEALTLRALEQNGIANRVVVAHDGAEALALLLGNESERDRASRPLPALVMLDLKLPKIDGLELLRRIRANERTRLVPVVVLTTSSEESDLVLSYRHGANSYVRKPVDFGQFSEAIRQLGLYWLVINESPPA